MAALGVSRPGIAVASRTVPSPAPPATGALAAPAFAIDLTLDLAGLSARQSAQARRAYRAAERFYEMALTGYSVAGGNLSPAARVAPLGPGLAPVQISAAVAPIDGPGRTLGRAGPTQVSRFTDLTGGRFSFTTQGVMQFDSADVATLLALGAFDDLVLHEMAHVLGFGLLWGPQFHSGPFSLYDKTAAPGEYTGAQALAMYRQEFDASAQFIPVETGTGMAGTDHLHWAQASQVWSGGLQELMTGFLNLPTYFSRTSLFAFRDLGYATLDAVPAIAVPLPAPVGLLGAALLISRLTFGARRPSRRRMPRTVPGPWHCARRAEG